MSEMMNQPPPSPGAPVLEPISIKVFGILHVVFGCFGALQILLGLVSLFFGDALARMQSGGNEQMYELQKTMADEMRVASVLSMLLMIVVTVLILRAGVKLLKKKKDGVRASTMYSFASIGAKIITLVLAVVYTIPASNRQFERMAEEMGGAGGAQIESMMGMMKMTTSVAGVIGPIVMCVYPLLSLFLLKKKSVRDYLNAFGK